MINNNLRLQCKQYDICSSNFVMQMCILQSTASKPPNVISQLFRLCKYSFSRNEQCAQHKQPENNCKSSIHIVCWSIWLMQSIPLITYPISHASLSSANIVILFLNYPNLLSVCVTYKNSLARKCHQNCMDIFFSLKYNIFDMEKSH